MANYVVGLTGGIGSGKTTASDRFRALGVTVVDADVEARRVVEPGEPALRAVVVRFGEEVLTADGRLDRPRLRRRVFHDAGERRWLERLLHPLVNGRMAEQLRQADSRYALLVNPLMRARDPRADRILVVDAPEEAQLRRTMRRDGVDEVQARATLAAQVGRKQRLAFADDVIVNDGDLAALREAVDALHKRYLRFAEREGKLGAESPKSGY